MSFPDDLQSTGMRLASWLALPLEILEDSDTCIGLWSATEVSFPDEHWDYEFFQDGRVRIGPSKSKRQEDELFWRLIEPGRLLLFYDDPTDRLHEWQYIGALGYDFAYVHGSDCMVLSNEDSSVVYVLRRA